MKLEISDQDLQAAIRDGLASYLATRDTMGTGLAQAIQQAVRDGLKQPIGSMDIGQQLVEAIAKNIDHQQLMQAVGGAVRGALQSWLDNHTQEVLDALGTAHLQFQGGSRPPKRRVAEASVADDVPGAAGD